MYVWIIQPVWNSEVDDNDNFETLEAFKACDS